MQVTTVLEDCVRRAGEAATDYTAAVDWLAAALRKAQTQRTLLVDLEESIKRAEVRANGEATGTNEAQRRLVALAILDGDPAYQRLCELRKAARGAIGEAEVDAEIARETCRRLRSLCATHTAVISAIH